MRRQESPQDVINAYQRRQQRTPFILGGLAVILVFIGVVVLVYWFTQGEKVRFNFAFLSTDTPTPTNTVTSTPVTPTLTVTMTLTETITPTITLTPTHSGPFEYVVEDGDNCWDIATKFNVDFSVLLALNNFGDGCPIQVGDTILIPSTGQQLPTYTPVAVDDLRGAVVEYVVQVGDTLDQIALDHLSTVEDIMTRNGIDNANTIYAGQKLQIKIGLITAVPSATATYTPVP